MHRLRCSVVIGAFAAAVSVLAAGPALAAKGGNSDNAHACQQGGSGGLVAAESGLPFKNAGDCASHGAQGNDTSGLVISMSMSPSDSYPCAFGPDCYGTVTGSGLLANSTVRLFFTFDQPGPPIESDVTADASGNLFSQLGNTCPTPSNQVPLVSAYATGTTAQNTPVQTPVVNDPCFKSTGR
jgi:hypothetical protein